MEKRESGDGTERQRNRRKIKKKNPFLVILVFLFFLGIVSSVLYISLEKYIPNMTVVSFFDYFDDLSRDGLYIVIEDERLREGNAPSIQNGEVFMPFDFIKEYLDPYIFWDEGVGKLTITTENKVMRMKTDELTYYINDKPFQLNLPVYVLNDMPYLSASYLEELYHVTISHKDPYGMVVVDYKDKSRRLGKVAAPKTVLRYRPDIKSPIELKLEMDEPLTLYEADGDFIRVRTEEGLLGYVLAKDMEETEMLTPIERTQDEPSWPVKTLEGKVNLVWDQITKVEANASERRRIVHEGVNVLSPTWFSFDEAMNGDIINIADIEYVKWAHEQGYQVWALITDNFDFDVSHAILSDTETREHVIKQLLAFISMYNLDGINIDFEAIREADVVYYLQFLRELAPFMKEQGAVLSVDMFVPLYTKYYNRTEVGKVVDYVCVMTYDEHTSVSPVSGPVASLGFVETGILETMKEVPKEKVLMGLPFYVRVWREVERDGETVRSLSNYGMDYAYELFVKNGAEFMWLEDVGSYYAEYYATEDGEEVTYRVWLEDKRSIEEKMKLAQKLGVAGVCSWQRGLESDGIFELIASYLAE